MKNESIESAKRTAQVYKYTAVFEPDEDVGGYTVTIPALSGCISEGDSYEEALENIKEAAELYLETENENEKSISKNKNKGLIITSIEVKI